MKLADEIIDWLLIRAGNSGDILIPNYYVDRYEMDVFRLTSSGIVIEYEVKVSKADFKSDFTKGYTSWRGNEYQKHKDIQEGKRCNRFFFVVPSGLITVDMVPEHCGLIFYDRGFFNMAKNAKMLSKEKKGLDFYQKVARKLSFRAENLRGKLRTIKKKAA